MMFAFGTLVAYQLSACSLGLYFFEDPNPQQDFRWTEQYVCEWGART